MALKLNLPEPKPVPQSSPSIERKESLSGILGDLIKESEKWIKLEFAVLKEDLGKSLASSGLFQLVLGLASLIIGMVWLTLGLAYALYTLYAIELWKVFLGLGSTMLAVSGLLFLLIKSKESKNGRN